MKRINNSDIRIRVSKSTLPEKFDFKFFTTDPATYIEKTQDDAVVSGDTVYIDLAWQYLQLLSTGIMCYELTRSYPDEKFPDGYFDTIATYTSDYYLETEAQPIPPSESATTLEIVIQLIEDMEGLYSAQLSAETTAREELGEDLHANYYTSAQTEQYVSDAIDDLHIGSYYTSAQTEEYVGEQVGAETAAREALADDLHSNYYTSAATQQYVQEAIQGGIDLSNYYTSAQTQEYVQEQGFLTEELEPAFNDSAAKNITSQDITNWDNKSDFSGSYNDLTDKPDLPDMTHYYTSGQTNEAIATATEGMATQEWVGEQGYLTTELEPAFHASPSSGITAQDITDWDNKSDFSGSYNDLTDKPTIPDVSDLFNDAQYDSQTKRINFYHGNTILCYIDAAAFVKDGMVDNVVIDNGYIKITFNTDAGKQEIDIPISDIFNAANYWTSGQTTQAIATASGATVTWVENQHYLTEHQSLANYYTSGQTNEAIATATTDMATETWVGQQGFLTSETEPDFNNSPASDITSNDINNWNGKSDFSGDYNDLQNKPDLSVYYTSGQTNSAISAATNDMATKTWVGNQNYLTTETEPAFNASVAKDISSSDITNWNDKIDAYYLENNGYATQAWVDQQGYSTFSGSYNDLTDKPNIPDTSQFYNSAQTQQYVSSALTPYATSAQTNTYVQSIVNGLKFVSLTQAEYDALVSASTVDANTLYFIQSGSTPPTPPTPTNAIEGTTNGTVSFYTYTDPQAEVHVSNGEFYVLSEDLSSCTSLADIFNADSSSENEMRSITAFTKFAPDMTNISSLEGAFFQCDSVTSINLTGLDISNLSSSNLSNMFGNCQYLTSLTFDGWTQANLVKLDTYSLASSLHLTELSLKDTTFTSDYDVTDHFFCENITALWLSAGYFQQGSRRSYEFNQDYMPYWTNAASLYHLANVIPDVTQSQYNDWDLRIPSATYQALIDNGYLTTITGKGWSVDTSGS